MELLPIMPFLRCPVRRREDTIHQNGGEYMDENVISSVGIIGFLFLSFVPALLKVRSMRKERLCSRFSGGHASIRNGGHDSDEIEDGDIRRARIEYKAC